MRRYLLLARVVWWAALVGLVELLIRISSLGHKRVIGATLLLAVVGGTAALMRPMASNPSVRHGTWPQFERSWRVCEIPLVTRAPQAIPIPNANGRTRVLPLSYAPLRGHVRAQGNVHGYVQPATSPSLCTDVRLETAFYTSRTSRP